MAGKDNISGKVLVGAASHARIMGRHLCDAHGRVSFDWPAVRLSFYGLSGTTAIAIRMHSGRSVLGYCVVHSSTTNSSDEDRTVVCQGVLSCYWHFHQRDYPVARDLDPNKQYDLSVWKQDDPGTGIVQLSGLLIDRGGSGTIVDGTFENVRRTRRHIEFVGNSDTVGFGNLSPKSGWCSAWCCQMPALLMGRPGLRTATDAARSFAAFTASILDCDYGIIALSGIGAQHSLNGMVENMCSVYDRALFLDPSTSMSISDGPKTDLVVVYIGNNDMVVLAELEDYSIFVSERSNVESLEGMLYKAFVNLLWKIRQRHPVPEVISDDGEIREREEDVVKIVVVLPHDDAILSCMRSERELKAGIACQCAAWSRAVEDMGGANAHIYTVHNRHQPQISLNSREDFGMMLHWNVSSCEKWASGLAPQLLDILAIANG